MRYGTLVLLLILGLSVFTLLPSVMAETEWQISKMNVEGQVYNIPYKITNGKVTEMKWDDDDGSNNARCDGSSLLRRRGTAGAGPGVDRSAPG